MSQGASMEMNLNRNWDPDYAAAEKLLMTGETAQWVKNQAEADRVIRAHSPPVKLSRGASQQPGIWRRGKDFLATPPTQVLPRYPPKVGNGTRQIKKRTHLLQEAGPAAAVVEAPHGPLLPKKKGGFGGVGGGGKGASGGSLLHQLDVRSAVKETMCSESSAEQEGSGGGSRPKHSKTMQPHQHSKFKLSSKPQSLRGRHRGVQGASGGGGECEEAGESLRDSSRVRFAAPPNPTDGSTSLSPRAPAGKAFVRRVTPVDPRLLDRDRNVDISRYGMTRHFYHLPSGMTPRRRKRESEKQRIYRLAQEERDRCTELEVNRHAERPMAGWTNDMHGRCGWLRTSTAVLRHDEKEKVLLTPTPTAL